MRRIAFCSLLALSFPLAACAEESGEAPASASYAQTSDTAVEPTSVADAVASSKKLAAAPTANSSSASAATFKEGKHYFAIKPAVKTLDPSKIEVAEVFWYGCSHCYTFEPSFQAWAKGVANDVAIVKVPAVWRPIMKLHGRMMFAAQAPNIYDKANMEIFKAMSQRKQFKTVDEIAEFFTQFGVTKDEAVAALNSFGVKSQAQQADARSQSFGVLSTPSLVVNGKYRIDPSAAGSHQNMLKVAEYLIEKERVASK